MLIMRSISSSAFRSGRRGVLLLATSAKDGRKEDEKIVQDIKEIMRYIYK